MRIDDILHWPEAAIRLVAQARNDRLPEHRMTTKASTPMDALTPKRFAVVAWSDAVPIHISPRGQRTEHLSKALQAYGPVDRIGERTIPKWLAGDAERTTSSWHRRLGRALMYSVLIDKYEIDARKVLRRWSPQVNAAVLVGYPWSPLPFAARKLAHNGIPYIVDVGDPWVLTNPDPEGGGFLRWRAARWERKLWASARGVIVTTQGQGDALKREFPHLSVLVRANGYNPNTTDAPPRSDDNELTARNDNTLRLVHYGSLYDLRVDFRAILARLAQNGPWNKIVLSQYGPDWEGSLESMSANIEVDHKSPISWAEVLAGAHRFDSAVVFGWRDPARMPSKTVQYLTLPIPRIAMVNSGSADALTMYLADKPGWAVINDEDHRAPEIVAEHLSKHWRQIDLQAPESEGWEAVERVLADFVVGSLADSTDLSTTASLPS